MCVNHQFVDDAQLKVKTEQPLVEFSNSFIVYCLFAEKYNLELCLILSLVFLFTAVAGRSRSYCLKSLRCIEINWLFLCCYKKYLQQSEYQQKCLMRNTTTINYVQWIPNNCKCMCSLFFKIATCGFVP